MRPIWHIISSFVLGLTIFYFTRSLVTGLIALTAGVFIDLDHLIDFWISAPENPFSVKQFFHMDRYLESKGDHYTLIFFHAWELIIGLVVLTIIYNNVYLIAFVLGILLHFALDTFNLEKTDHPLTYSLIFRALKKFKLKNVDKSKSNY